jgi:predicted DCC family thiol-disulfide oxidoreductase YuxK
MNESNVKIVFFDGVCNLCNGFINFIFANNKDQSLKVASLQGETAQKYLTETEISKLSTVIYYKNGEKVYRSRAVIFILKDMGFPFSMSLIFLIIPDLLRDLMYKFIANNRYRFFGKKDSCRLPTAEEKERFLP